jgi:hypothetical protein
MVAMLSLYNLSTTRCTNYHALPKEKSLPPGAPAEADRYRLLVGAMGMREIREKSRER